MAKKLTSIKAKEILTDGSVHGKPLTAKQKRFFGAIAGGAPIKAKSGGWLDSYQEGGVESTQAGYTDIPFNYNSAWGGQFAMGGSLPGSVGFTYARTQGAAPSNGPYAKKTKASAQDGGYFKNYLNQMDQDYKDWYSVSRGKDDGFDSYYHHLTDQSPMEITTGPAWLVKNNKFPDDKGNYLFGKTLPKDVQAKVDKGRFTAEFVPSYTSTSRDQSMDSYYSDLTKYLMSKNTPTQKNGGMTYYQHGLDWKPKTISKNGGWLDEYIPEAQKGIFIPGVTDFKPMVNASESTSIVRNTPKGQVSTSTTGLTKQQMKEQSDAMMRQSKKEEEEKKARIAERKAAVASRDKNKPFTFPTGETKTYDQMDWREKNYVAGKALEQKGRFNENDEAWYDDWINPFGIIGNISGALGTAPYEAKQSDSNLPYVGAVISPLVMGRAMGSGSINPFGKKFWTNEVSNKEFINNMLFGVPGLVEGAVNKVGQSMESGLLSKFSKPTSNINLQLFGFGRKKPIMPEVAPLSQLERQALVTQEDLARANRDAITFSQSPANRAKLQEFRPGQDFSITNQQARFIDDPEALKLYESYKLENNPSLSIEQYLGGSRGQYGARDYGDLNDVVLIDKNQPFTSNIPSRSAYTDAMHETTHSRSIRLGATDAEKEIASDAWSPMIKKNNFGMPEEEAFAVQNELRTDKLKDIKGDRVYTEKDIPEIKKGLQEMINEGHDYLRNVNIEDFNIPALIKSLNKIGLGAAVIGIGGKAALQQKKKGGVIKDDRGQWAHPGEITEIGSNRITMQGVPYPVLGISNTGDTQMMFPGEEYKFKGKKVTEIPMAQKGKTLPPIYTDDPRKVKANRDSFDIAKKAQMYINERHSGGPNEYILNDKNSVKDIPYSQAPEKGWYEGVDDFGIAFSKEFVFGNDQIKPSYFKAYKDIGDLRYIPIYDFPKQEVRFKPKPAPPQLDKVGQVQFQNMTSGRQMPNQISINERHVGAIPLPQRGQYRVSYYNPEMKDWDEAAFMSQQESDQFANEMSGRGFGGSYGNVTQTKKVNQKENGGWLNQYK